MSATKFISPTDHFYRVNRMLTLIIRYTQRIPAFEIAFLKNFPPRAAPDTY
jgi:hypothetical protein